MSSEPLPESNTKPSIFTKLKLNRLSLPGALVCVIIMAGCIVAVGYFLYLQNPNKKYDLARPGQKDNLSLHVEDDEADTTGPVTAAATKQKIEYLNKELSALNSISRFEPEDLNDQNIQLVPADQPSL